MKHKILARMPYPTEQDSYCGIKVSWNYYTLKEDADRCAIAARHNADIKASLGYDFGYQCPGTVKLCKSYQGEWEKFNGMYEVCLP